MSEPQLLACNDLGKSQAGSEAQVSCAEKLSKEQGTKP